jgi:hypothetical protein
VRRHLSLRFGRSSRLRHSMMLVALIGALNSACGGPRYTQQCVGRYSEMFSAGCEVSCLPEYPDGIPVFMYRPDPVDAVRFLHDAHCSLLDVNQMFELCSHPLINVRINANAILDARGYGQCPSRSSETTERRPPPLGLASLHHRISTLSCTFCKHPQS